MTEYLMSQIPPEDLYPREKLLHYVEYKDLGGDKSRKMFISHFGYTFCRQAGGAAMTVLREPTERILSLYSYWKNPGRGRAPGDPLPDDMFLEGFLKSDRVDIRTNIDNAQTWQVAFGLNDRVRRRLAGLTEIELLDVAIKNLATMRIVGIAEDMASVLRQLSRYFGEPAPPLGVYNKSEQRVRREDIGQWELREIESRTSLDKKLYEAAIAESERRSSVVGR